jgi:hypothetical protein
MSRKYRVTVPDPCEVCGALNTEIYEGSDGARASACCLDHAKKALGKEEEMARKELARFFKSFQEYATSQ